jgi:hypothetical protein
LGALPKKLNASARRKFQLPSGGLAPEDEPTRRTILTACCLYAGVEKISQMAVAFDGTRVMVLPKGANPPKKSAAKKVGESMTKAAKKSAAPAKKAPMRKR